MTETPNQPQQPEIRTVQKYLEVYQAGVRIYHSAVDLVSEGNSSEPRNLKMLPSCITYRKDGKQADWGKLNGYLNYKIDSNAITITGKGLVAIIKDTM